MCPTCGSIGDAPGYPLWVVLALTLAWMGVSILTYRLGLRRGQLDD